MFMLYKNCKQESKSENIVKWVFLGSFKCSKANSIALPSNVNIVASEGIRTENISLLTLVAVSLDSHVTIFRLLHAHGTSEIPM